MTKQRIVCLAPIGCALMLVFSSLVPFRMMSEIGIGLDPDSQPSDVTSLAPVGGVGAVLFGLAMVALTLVNRKGDRSQRMMLGVGAVLMFLSAVASLLANVMMMLAFRDLAMSELIDPESFLSSFQLADPLVIIGGGLLIVASVIVAVASMMAKTEARVSRTAVTVSVISFVFLLLMVVWNQVSIRAFAQVWANHSFIEPSMLAAGVSGTLRSDFMFQGAVMSFAVATMFVAISKRGESADKEDAS